MKNKRGFTLIELLAVIVILAVILAIAVPGISNIISVSTKAAAENDAKMVIKAIAYKMLDDSGFHITSIDETNIESTLGISDDNYQTVKVTTLSGQPYVVLVGKNKWENLIAYGTYTDMNVSDSSNYATIINQLGYNSSKDVNEPKLAGGMTPIKWNGTKWVDTTENDSEWYNYTTTDKKWANARTSDGSMWVWVPRYIYKISSGWHTSTVGTIDIQLSKGIDDNWNSSSIGNINTDTTSNASNGTWTNPPAFDFGSTKLTGIWVAKFKASNSNDNVKVVPSVASWRSITINDIFNKVRSMETNAIYGWGTSGSGMDTHLAKNTEWGAVAYLSKSTYGKNDEVWVNNSNTFTTGCAGTSATSGSATGCINAYDSTYGIQASTTGNIYGIYDMSGGWEYTSSYLANSNINLTTYGNSVYTADSKYKNVYTVAATDTDVNNYLLTISSKGDALYEIGTYTTSIKLWYNDYPYMPKTDSPWLARAGDYYLGSSAGIFSIGSINGGALSNYGFRPVLAVNAGL
jgi:type IV pilus assembly protein PilA